MNKSLIAALAIAALSFAATAAPVADHDDFAAIREATAPTALTEALANDCGKAVNAQEVWDGLTPAAKADPKVVDKFSNVCSTFGINAT